MEWLEVGRGWNGFVFRPLLAETCYNWGHIFAKRFQKLIDCKTPAYSLSFGEDYQRVGRRFVFIGYKNIMGKKTKYNVGRLNTNAKKDVIEHAKKILNSGVAPRDLDGDDLIFMLAAIEHHHALCNADYTRIEIRMNYQHRGFYAIKESGESRSFSYKKLFIANSKLWKQRFNTSARHAITQHMRSFMRKNYNGTCQLTNKPLALVDAVIDHAPPHPFNLIVKNFIEDNHVKIDDLSIYISADNGWYFRPKFAARFLRFHNELAVLRVVSRKENSRLGSHGL